MRRRRSYSFSEISESWGTLFVSEREETGTLEHVKGRPVAMLLLLLSATFIILGLRFGQLTLVDGERNRDLADGNRIRVVTVGAPRGALYDRSGILLAANSPDYQIVATPADLPARPEEQAGLWQRLGALLGKDPSEFDRFSGERESVPFEPVILARSLSQEQALLVRTHYPELPGISVQAVPVRNYLFPDLYAHPLGYTSQIDEASYRTKDKRRYSPSDQIGKTGIEAQYENLLHGTNGARQIEVDSGGRPVRTLNSIEPIPGQNLVLTLDHDLQQKMRESLSAMMIKTNARGAAAVALNPETGEVLGYVSLPDFDPEAFARGIDEGSFQRLLSDKREPLFDRVISGAFSPGSAIKPFIATVALEAGTITPATTITGPAQIEVAGSIFRDWRTHGSGLNLQRAIAVSSNVYFYGVGGGFDIQGVGRIKGLGIERLASGLRKYAFGEATGIDLPGEAAGLVPTPEWKERVKKEPWYLADTYHASIGQGDLMTTPLQLVVSLGAIANGGTLFRPYLLDRVVEEERIIRKTKPHIIRGKIFSESVLRTVRAGMREAVISGSATPLRDLPEEVAAKTGTAEQGADNVHNHAWTEAYGPVDDPTIALVVMVERGGESFEVAVPVVKEILAHYFRNR